MRGGTDSSRNSQKAVPAWNALSGLPSHSAADARSACGGDALDAAPAPVLGAAGGGAACAR